jgi:hypothetical protein
MAHYEIYEGIADLKYETWMDACLEILGRCDAIFMMDNWPTSKGANIEINHAMALKKEIFHERDGIPSPKDKGIIAEPGKHYFNRPDDDAEE